MDYMIAACPFNADVALFVCNTVIHKDITACSQHKNMSGGFTVECKIVETI